MRHIGTVPDEDAARIFHDYLLARGISSQIEPESAGDEWSVWVIDEDHVSDARDKLARYRSDPSAPEYAEATARAKEIRRERERREREIRRKTVDIRRRWERPIYARAPVTSLLILLSVLTVLLTTDWGSNPFEFGDRMEPVGKWLFISPFSIEGKIIRWPGLRPIEEGQVWRLVTPIFLHFNPLHLLFNMMWLRQLGTAIELRRGSLKLLWFVLVIAAISNVAQYLQTGPNFGGMSGVVFGLFGYIWLQSRLDPFSGFFIPPNLVFFAIAYLVLCMTGIFGPVANTAHVAGLVVGALLAAARPLFGRRR